MKIQSILGLCLSASLVLAAPAAMADKGKSKGKSPAAKVQAMQIKIDKKTGKKLSAEDDSDLSAKAAAAAPLVDAKGMMPAQSQAVQRHADGSMSAQLGVEHLQYTVLTIGEDGQQTMTHQRIDEIADDTNKQTQNEGEQ